MRYIDVYRMLKYYKKILVGNLINSFLIVNDNIMIKRGKFEGKF